MAMGPRPAPGRRADENQAVPIGPRPAPGRRADENQRWRWDPSLRQGDDRMKINDAVWGALFLLLAVAILIHVQGFPTIPGQKFGPALFPGVIAAGLGACALVLLARGFAKRGSRGNGARWIAVDDWIHSRRHVVGFATVLGINVLYVAVVDRLGFIITGTIYLGALFAVFGVRVRSIVPLAVVITLGIHYAFYKLLKVPLPWGILERLAW